MQIFRELAGYSFGHADVVRRAMAKKKASVLAAEREAFLSGCAVNGIAAETAGELFEDLASFANYAFNKSHAAAYAVISYRTAYLKEHAPRAYFAALLTSELGNMPKIAEYIAEVGKRGIRVLPPDINASDIDFSVSGKDIRFALLALKNVGRQFLSAVVEERRRGGAYRSFDDFLDRMSTADLNKRQIESLIKSGAFDTLGVCRSRLMAVYESMIDRVQSKNRTNLTGQLDMFSAIPDERPDIAYPDLPEFPLKELLMQEKEAAGMYFSGHILDGFAKALSAPEITEMRELAETDEAGDFLHDDRERVTVAGIITAMTVKQTKNGDRMAFFTLEDRYSEMECLVFPKVLERFADILTLDAVVRVSGNLSLREDENPKIVLSEALRLNEDGHEPSPAPAAPAVTVKTPAAEKPAARFAVDPANAKILYLRVPDLSSALWRKANNILEIFEGTLPVSVYSKATASYTKLSYGFDCTPFTLRELVDILGEENVVLK
jgi:DNA polymerase-3 subunit alpha